MSIVIIPRFFSETYRRAQSRQPAARSPRLWRRRTRYVGLVAPVAGIIEPGADFERFLGVVRPGGGLAFLGDADHHLREARPGAGVGDSVGLQQAAFFLQRLRPLDRSLPADLRGVGGLM